MNPPRPTLRLVLAALLATGLAALPNSALAHEKWFHDARGLPLRWDLFLRPLPLAFAGGVLLLTALAWLLQRRLGRGLLPEPERLGAVPERRAALYGLIPAILAVHLAVPLLVAGVQGQLFASSNPLPLGWANLVGLLETGVALALFYGGLTRVAALVLAWTWLLGAALLGLEPALENAHVLGFAVFFYLAGRGPISIDRLLFPRLEPSEAQMRLAMPALRVGVGLSLVVVAFTEKFANLPLALAFLARYPFLNFTSAVGVPLSNEVFVLCAGAVELLAGLWITLGVFPREIILVAWLPFNLTLTIFNWQELVGHLPFYGALAALLVWGTGRDQLGLWVAGLRRGHLAIAEPGVAPSGGRAWEVLEPLPGEAG